MFKYLNGQSLVQLVLYDDAMMACQLKLGLFISRLVCLIMPWERAYLIL
jgi:hypothetical protein